VRLAIVSDIHGNLEALETVLEDARTLGYDRLACLGDIVGYGANPEECVQRIRQEAWVGDMGQQWVVKGNHDEAVTGGDTTYFNPAARKAAEWTRKQISSSSTIWLQSLPYEIAYQDIYLVHSSPCDPEEWNYITTRNDAEVAFERFRQTIGFIGHSHVPFHLIQPSGTRPIWMEEGERVEMVNGNRYLSNVGSVGQPRDGDNRSSYVILDTDQKTIERRRVAYPYEQTAVKIRQAGLPDFLAERLKEGR
jgi:diadenosine tetraphosphatase ApaH/serine/threonine PP2A family protein phosphatase